MGSDAGSPGNLSGDVDVVGKAYAATTETCTEHPQEARWRIAIKVVSQRCLFSCIITQR